MNILIDGIYNNFTVLGEAGKDSSNGEQRYLCVCICGAKRDVRKSNLWALCVPLGEVLNKPTTTNNYSTTLIAHAVATASTMLRPFAWCF